MSVFATLDRLWCFWATHGLPSLRRQCTVGIDWDPPACSHIQGDVTAERQPFVVGVVLKSCGLGRGRRNVFSRTLCQLLELRILTLLLDGLRLTERDIVCIPSFS